MTKKSLSPQWTPARFAVFVIFPSGKTGTRTSRVGSTNDESEIADIMARDMQARPLPAERTYRVFEAKWTEIDAAKILVERFGEKEGV